MSISQYQKQVNTLDKEIAELEKKKANKDKDAASLQKNINSVQKSITKNTSQSLLRSKLNKISSYESELAKRNAESANLGKSIAEKKKKRAEAALKLQKAQTAEQKKQNEENERIQHSYQNRISELEQQLEKSLLSKKNSSIDEGNVEYDVFISHASEDKETFVDEFACELEKRNIKVWYDKNIIGWGGSLRESIDKGLVKSKFGVVVLSPDYIDEKKYWTKAELNALFQLETINGKVILPIWHNLTKKQVIEYSPIIADKKAMTTATMTAEEIADELQNLLSIED